MAWVKIDDLFYDHPKWADAPGDSIALWLAAMAWCNRNDSIEGFIPTLKLHGLIHVRNVKRTVADLVARAAFHPVDGGYLIHDYPEYQQPARVKEIRGKRSAAGRKGAAVRWGEKARAAEYAEAPPHTDAMANDMANAIANGCPDTRLPNTGLHTQESSSTENTPPPVDDDLFARALELIVDAKVRDRNPSKPNAYRMTTRTNTITEDGEAIRRLLADGDPPDQVAAFVLGHGIGTERERSGGVPWCDDSCAECGGLAWVWVNDGAGGLAPCPNRRELA